MEIVAGPQRIDALAGVVERAFAPEGVPEAARVARLLRELAATPPKDLLVLSGWAEGAAVAVTAWSRLQGAGAATWILSPVAVAPDRQRSGLGTRLIEAGIARLRGAGADLLAVYGDPAYYGRFGFDAAHAPPAPHPLGMPFGWQGLPLVPGAALAGPVRPVPALDDPALW
ncbi:GNAT family N-acetyltransferase [Jannaschia sp. Os4]|uniref:GNAT family N-acetyltransferase n=1 Tax=Jannaschia sp. Os4 TaxID=2807617 RepID=UPI00193994C3|nr:GNAT family N-acetyltransferase [Jannaschia sp. Os4]MBM2577314.1 GNAT family N-acetyltransferase [Jannaschia sp. Os4]